MILTVYSALLFHIFRLLIVTKCQGFRSTDDGNTWAGVSHTWHTEFTCTMWCSSFRWKVDAIWDTCRGGAVERSHIRYFGALSASLWGSGALNVRGVSCLCVVVWVAVISACRGFIGLSEDAVTTCWLQSSPSPIKHTVGGFFSTFSSSPFMRNTTFFLHLQKKHAGYHYCAQSLCDELWWFLVNLPEYSASGPGRCAGV